MNAADVTDDAFAALSWPQKRRLHHRLEAEAARLLDRVEQLQAACTQVQASAAYVQAEATRILALLPTDPEAGEHRRQLCLYVTDKRN